MAGDLSLDVVTRPNRCRDGPLACFVYQCLKRRFKTSLACYLSYCLSFRLF